ncbi:MAG: hypothetical protein ABMA13_11215 [Chthoniobacteraceae bacterium]
MKHTLPLLALVCSAFAADTPKTLIEISSRFTETDAKTGKVDLLSAPRITTREGCRATIEITRETHAALPETAVKDALIDFTTGIVLDVTAWMEGDDVILRGIATMRELDGEMKAARDGMWAHLRVDEVPFVLRLKSGEPRDLPLATSARSDRMLTIQITAKNHVPVNASPLYWQAFAAMPKLDDAEKRLLDAKSPTPGDAERALVAKADAALKLFAEASRADFCEWNLDLAKGPSLALPHLGPLRDIAKLALLKARLGDARAASDQHAQVLLMARHVAATPLLISRLVGISIETMAIESAAAMLPQWDEKTPDFLVYVVQYVEPAPSIAECVAAEGKNMSAWLSVELDAEVKKSGAALDVRAWLGQLLAPIDQNSDEVLKQLGTLPKDEAGVRKLIEDYRTQMTELARIIGLPREEMKKEAAAFEQTAKTDAQRNVFIALLAPAVLKARESELKGEARLALLRAALDVQAKGESALPADRATYRKTEHGFELTSKEQFDGKPVVLTVGPR